MFQNMGLLMTLVATLLGMSMGSRNLKIIQIRRTLNLQKKNTDSQPACNPAVQQYGEKEAANSLITSTPFPTQVSPLILPNITTTRDVDERCNEVNYTIVAGDTLNKIAASFEVSLQDILDFNPEVSHPSAIFIGQSLIIPTCQQQHTQGSKELVCGVVYRVQKGDTLFSMATILEIPVQHILDINQNINDQHPISINQLINIPPCLS